MRDVKKGHVMEEYDADFDLSSLILITI